MNTLRTKWMLACGLAIAIVISACGGNNLLYPEQCDCIEEGRPLYAQVNMWYYKDKQGVDTVHSANYHLGTRIPINSEIRLLKEYDKESIYFEYNGKKIRLVNVEQYSGVDLMDLVDRTFSTMRADLSHFSDAERKQIQLGKIAKGMSKEAVKRSRGYPPLQGNSSFESDRWKYLDNRFKTSTVVFKDEVVVSFD